MSYKGFCRAALSTPGLLNRQQQKHFTSLFYRLGCTRWMRQDYRSTDSITHTGMQPSSFAGLHKRITAIQLCQCVILGKKTNTGSCNFVTKKSYFWGYVESHQLKSLLMMKQQHGNFLLGLLWPSSHPMKKNICHDNKRHSHGLYSKPTSQFNIVQYSMVCGGSLQCISRTWREVNSNWG